MWIDTCIHECRICEKPGGVDAGARFLALHEGAHDGHDEARDFRQTDGSAAAAPRAAIDFDEKRFTFLCKLTFN